MCCCLAPAAVDTNERGLQCCLLLLLPLLHREVQLIKIYVHVTSTCVCRGKAERLKRSLRLFCLRSHVFSTLTATHSIILLVVSGVWCYSTAYTVTEHHPGRD